MKHRIMLGLAGLLLSLAAAATDSVRFGSQLIAVGDSEGKVYRVAGEPTRRIQLQNGFGAAMGYRLDYDQGNKTVEIVISGGQVVRIIQTDD